MEGKVALITGGVHGIGAASAGRFAAEDARVLITLAGTTLEDFRRLQEANQIGVPLRACA